MTLGTIRSCNIPVFVSLCKDWKWRVWGSLVSGSDLWPGHGPCVSEAVEEVGGQHCFDSELPGMFKHFGNVVKFKFIEYLLVIGLYIRVLYIADFSIADEVCFTQSGKIILFCWCCNWTFMLKMWAPIHQPTAWFWPNPFSSSTSVLSLSQKPHSNLNRGSFNIENYFLVMRD